MDRHDLEADERRATEASSISVLRHEIISLHRLMDSFNTKIDVVIKMQGQIATLQEQHGTSRRDLDKAVAVIERFNPRVSQVEVDISNARMAFRTALAVGALLGMFALWFASQTLAEIHENTKGLIELRQFQSREWPLPGGNE